MHGFSVMWHYARSADAAHFAFLPARRQARTLHTTCGQAIAIASTLTYCPDSKQVLRTTRGTYGYVLPGVPIPYRKIDHCQYLSGMYDVLATSEAKCENGVVTPDPTWATCIAIPPKGKRNSKNQTTEEALLAARTAATAGLGARELHAPEVLLSCCVVQRSERRAARATPRRSLPRRAEHPVGVRRLRQGLLCQ